MFSRAKRVEKVILGPEFFFTKLVKKWTKYGQKLFSRPKIGPKCPRSGCRPRKYLIHIDQKMS